MCKLRKQKQRYSCVFSSSSIPLSFPRALSTPDSVLQLGHTAEWFKMIKLNKNENRETGGERERERERERARDRHKQQKERERPRDRDTLRERETQNTRNEQVEKQT